MDRELPTSLLMAIAARAASTRIFEVLQAEGFDDVTIAQSRLIAGIDEDGTRVSVLAARAQIAKQTATALVDKLERAGYVERLPDPADGRARLVRLTPRATAALPVARRRRGELLGGEEGRALVEAANAWMTEQTIKSPTRMTEMLAPGFDAPGR